MTTSHEAEALFGNRFLTERAPSTTFPENGMRPTDAMRLLAEDLNLEGDPQRNLATFVTTWMEPEAQRIIAENLHRNFIDHAEYPISAEIEQRCVRMLADLFHAPGETTGCRTQGSSEAIMLGALSLKWKWKERREAENRSTDRPNLVFGGDVHVVWEKFCRYFDVEPRIVPLEKDKYTIGPADVEPHLDENTIGVAAVLGTTFTGHMDDIPGINQLLLDIKSRRGLDIPLHVDGASGAFVWPFLHPDSQWDFALEQVRSINVSGHKYGLVYPGIGWLVFREKSDLAEDLVFYENYLGKTDATFTLNFSTGAAMVLAQYYNFVRLGRDGYTYVMKQMQQNANTLATNLRESGRFEVIGDDLEQLPLVAFRLAGDHASYDESDIAWQLSAERGWMVPAYTLPPNAQEVKIMRALVKETMSREQVERLTQDIADACTTLDEKGGTTQTERQQVKRGTGY
ncbi:glutamate decarboxylase [Nocardioides euryhalodurans]|uniref:Glutamate decarboxylase n=1 Tax=Nocardioides euryhalodurans TaxID=2518370 RepID=A0A4P7GLJ3_9ACTN|nr:glutamate decarboxylase [Nocardioides euryhalodurans]QBR92739.1 glutamate decarboxylase [Nocardioides euryhalodurans]